MSIAGAWEEGRGAGFPAPVRRGCPSGLVEEDVPVPDLPGGADTDAVPQELNGHLWWAMVEDVESCFVTAPPDGSAGTRLDTALNAARSAMCRATLTTGPGAATGGAVALAEQELITGLGTAADAVAAGHVAVFVLVREAVTRKLHLDVGMGVHDWVRRRCPSLPPQLLNDLITVARSATGTGTDLLADALTAGTTAPHRAAQVVRTLERLRPCLTHDQQLAYATIAADAAANPAITDRDLSILCRTLLHDLLEEPPDHGTNGGGPDGDDGGTGSVGADGEAAPGGEAGTDDAAGADGDCVAGQGAGGQGSGQASGPGGPGSDGARARTPGERAQALRTLTRRPVGPGLTRYTIDAPDADAALLDGILNGPLAAPTPTTGADGTAAEPDLRPAAQRRYDALLTVLHRGLGHPGAPPSTARASVIITLKADPATGRPTGAALTQTGQVLPSAHAGTYACTGDVTPLVLGQHGEPLHLGRTRRLATPGQHKALLVRDVHCTYPGCTIPGTWCDAHHLRWWSRGGTTDITNLTLLCPRHHTLVHTRDLHATITGAVITWHV